MIEKRKRKIMPFLLTLILIISMITIMPTGTLAQEVKWYNKYDAEKTVFDDMTPGDVITVKGSDLTEDQRYYVYFEEETGDPELLDDQKANDKGEIEIEVNVPYRDTLGLYQIYLLNQTWANDGSNVSGSPIDVWINNTYKVKYKSGGEYLDYVLLAKEYYYPDYLEISVWNWTGSKYTIFDDGPIDITLYDPSGSYESDDTTSTGYWNLDFIFDFDENDHYENNYWVDVYYDADHTAYQPLPVKLNMTATLPSNPEWGDMICTEGYLFNGTGVVRGYDVVLLAPSGDTYVEADRAATYSSGRYSLIAPSDEGGASAGTWYVGTWDDGPYRIDETDIVNWPGFIHYYCFKVASSDTAIVKLESPEEVIYGFDQDLNISVYNTSWDYNYYYDDMWMHITGLETEWMGVTYDADDIVVIGHYSDIGTGISSNEKYAYYEINDIKFNESGKFTIIVTWEHNNTYYEKIRDLQANITGTKFIYIGNKPPDAPFDPDPYDNETDVIINPTLSVNVSDLDDDTMNVSFYDKNDILIGFDTNVTNGSRAFCLWEGLDTFTTYSWYVVANDGKYDTKSDIWTFTTVKDNQPPEAPTINGPAEGKPGVEYTYYANTTDPDGDQLYYKWDWGDNSYSEWLGPFNSGIEIPASHTWSRGSFEIRVKAKDINNHESEWSDPFPITMLRDNLMVNWLVKFLERFLALERMLNIWF